MSREGVSIAARDRARRLQALLGEGATVLMGCTLVVLHDAPRRASTTGLAKTVAAAAAANDGASGATVAPVAAAERRR